MRCPPCHQFRCPECHRFASIDAKTAPEKRSLEVGGTHLSASYRRVWTCPRCSVELMEAPVVFEIDVDVAANGDGTPALCSDDRHAWSTRGLSAQSVNDVERMDWRGRPVARGGYLKRRYGVQLIGELRCKTCHVAVRVQTVSFYRPPGMEREWIGERTRGTGHAPLGFASSGKREQLSPVLEDLVTVQLILDLHDAGWSYRAIASNFNSAGVLTKLGARWHHTTVRGIVRRRVWCESQLAIERAAGRGFRPWEDGWEPVSAGPARSDVSTADENRAAAV